MIFPITIEARDLLWTFGMTLLLLNTYLQFGLLPALLLFVLIHANSFAQNVQKLHSQAGIIGTGDAAVMQLELESIVNNLTLAGGAGGTAISTLEASDLPPGHPRANLTASPISRSYPEHESQAQPDGSQTVSSTPQHSVKQKDHAAACQDQVAALWSLEGELKAEINRKDEMIKTLEDAQTARNNSGSTARIAPKAAEAAPIVSEASNGSKPEKPDPIAAKLEPMSGSGSEVNHDEESGLTQEQVVAYLVERATQVALERFDEDRFPHLSTFRDVEPVPKYLEQLGEGGMGVCRVACRSTGEVVAVNCCRMPVEDMSELGFDFSGMCTAALTTLVCFGNENRLLDAIWNPNGYQSDLQNIVRYLGYREFTTNEGKTDRNVFLERCDGSVHDLRQERNMTNTEALDLFRKIMLGLTALHRRGYVHGDMKEANVLFKIESGKRVFKLADFGCSWDMRKGDICDGFSGSCEYWSPERYPSTSGTSLFLPASDIFTAYVLWLRARKLLKRRRSDNDFSDDSQARRMHQIREAAKSDAVFPMFKMCVTRSPDKRLTAEEIVRIIDTHPRLAKWRKSGESVLSREVWSADGSDNRSSDH